MPPWISETSSQSVSIEVGAALAHTKHNNSIVGSNLSEKIPRASELRVHAAETVAEKIQMGAQLHVHIPSKKAMSLAMTG